ncbi:MAG: hypothetical protein GXO55_06995 [Chloroflexi bacterium]|nr:hypothetical protein [Chloroflexota bacterium]
MTAPEKWYDEDKVDDVVLALLYLNLWEDGRPPLVIYRAWKSFPWEVLDRLYEKGYIDNPRSKAKSVVFTEEGRRRAEELFFQLFGLDQEDNAEE